MCINNHSIIEEIKSIYLKGEEMINEKEFNKALEYFDNAIQKYPLSSLVYKGKYYAIKGLLSKVSMKYPLIQQALACLDKCILLDIENSNEYRKYKIEIYKENRKYGRAISTIKQIILCNAHNPFDFCDIAYCYYKLHEYGKAEYYYKLAISYVSSFLNTEINSKLKELYGQEFPVKSKRQTNSIYHEETYYIPEIHYKLSIMYNEMGYYYKALTEILKAINESNWLEYYLYKSIIYKNIKKLYNTDRYDLEITRSLEKYYSYCLCTSETNHSILYAFIRSGNQSLSTVDGYMFPYLFMDYPQSIIDIFNIDPMLDISNDLIVQYYNRTLPIEDFTFLMSYYRTCNNYIEAIRKNAILRYFLGGIASSFYFFDEIIDQEPEELTPMEMFYYSKTAKILDVEFNSIVDFNISALEKNTTNDKDYYYLGHLYLLKGNKYLAKKNFEISKEFLFSEIMLRYLNTDVSASDNIHAMLSTLSIKKDIDIHNTDLSQFEEYFHMIECGDAIEYIFSKDTAIIEFINTPIWDVFQLHESSKDFVMNKIKHYSLEMLAKSLNLQDICDNKSEQVEYLIKEIEHHNNILQPISVYCKDCNIDNKTILALSLYYYQTGKISYEDFMCLNIYRRNCMRGKYNTKVLVYSIFSSTSLIDTYLGVLMDILFYILDNNTNMLNYNVGTYKEYKASIIKNILSDKYYETIKNIFKK